MLSIEQGEPGGTLRSFSNIFSDSDSHRTAATANARKRHATMSTKIDNNSLTVQSYRRKKISTEYRIARGCAERAEAFRLIYNAYLKTGLAKPNPFSMRLLRQHLLPTTDMFVAVCADEVQATVTLIRDGDSGLPMDCVYRAEVNRLRQAGKKLAEVSCLADHGAEINRNSLPRCLELFRWMVQAARVRGTDALVVAINPRHLRFYERYLDFERIGNEAAYPAVCDQPAIALLLDFERIDRERPKNYRRFFGRPIQRKLLAEQPITPTEICYFRQVLAAVEETTEEPPHSGTPSISDPSAIYEVTLSSTICEMW
jgi:hypothetical protein